MKITHRKAVGTSHECIMEARWYARDGSFFIEAVGYGASSDEAEKSARLMLGQARAELSKATTEEAAL